MANTFVKLNLRIAQVQQEIRTATEDGVKEVFNKKILPAAKALSPRSAELKPGETIHNADSIKTSFSRTKKGISARIFTTSGHGYFLEKGTSKTPAHPYLYPAFQMYAASLFGTVKLKLKLPPKAKVQSQPEPAEGKVNA